MPKPWTAQEAEVVRELYCVNGLTDQQIGQRILRSAGAVANFRQAKKIQRPTSLMKCGRPWTQEDLLKLREMYGAGVLNQTIAEALNRTRISVKRAITTFNLKRGSLALAEASVFDRRGELWRTVPGHASYAVSTLGRVRKLTPDFRILAQWIDADGYAHVSIAVGRGHRRKSVHRLVALAFLGAPPTPQHQVAHNDGRPANNSLPNLRWATAAENQRDRLFHGTAVRGAGGKFVKCTERRCGIAA